MFELFWFESILCFFFLLGIWWRYYKDDEG